MCQLALQINSVQTQLPFLSRSLPLSHKKQMKFRIWRGTWRSCRLTVQWDTGIRYSQCQQLEGPETAPWRTVSCLGWQFFVNNPYLCCLRLEVPLERIYCLGSGPLDFLSHKLRKLTEELVLERTCFGEQCPLYLRGCATKSVAWLRHFYFLCEGKHASSCLIS